MKKVTVLATVSLLALAAAGCTAHPDAVAARSVNPVGYQAWRCENLPWEQRRLSGEIQRVASLQRQNAVADAASLTVGLLVFWPALFGMAMTHDRSEELGRLRGEYEAVDVALRDGLCNNQPAPVVHAYGGAGAAGVARAAARGPTDTVIIERALEIHRRTDEQIAATLRTCPAGREMRCAAIVVELEENRNRALLLNGAQARAGSPRT
ncbi:MAG: hypothetical protein K2X74_08705 [Acetobacteraceae bacterium]|nr:hypothetical protein [Acetobacteraceae bacterium]